MMNFRVVKENLIDVILGPAESGRFQVIGFQRQVKNAEEVIDANRLVQVFYSSSDFSKRGGRLTGPVQHDVTYRVELTVSKAAQADLSVINNEEATSEELTAAIAGFQEASQAADESLDELFEIIYQILMDARNCDIGLSDGIVTNRWVSRMQKDDPIPRGEHVVITGSINFMLRTVEQVPGDTNDIIATEFAVVIDQDGDDVEKAGVEGTLGG